MHSVVCRDSEKDLNRLTNIISHDIVVISLLKCLIANISYLVEGAAL